MVKVLLDAGADPNIADKNEDCSLHWLYINGCCSTVAMQEIIDHCAHVNAINKDGATALLLACSTAQTESVRLLLDAKADPNATYADGDASLHTAVAADCSKETRQELINYGDVPMGSVWVS